MNITANAKQMGPSRSTWVRGRNREELAECVFAGEESERVQEDEEEPLISTKSHGCLAVISPRLQVDVAQMQQLVMKLCRPDGVQVEPHQWCRIFCTFLTDIYQHGTEVTV